MSLNDNKKKAYVPPELSFYGNLEQITRSNGVGPKQTSYTDLFYGDEGEGLPPGKVPGNEDMFMAMSMS
ncbi:MAG TPA: hypothetical protein VGW77_18255 [Candidatus Binatia bacterium]|jgi:hypothetical protein|nr:hypothetical protein [Candidatus Binatia bacterium]